MTHAAERLAQAISEEGTESVEALFEEIDDATHEAISHAIYDAAFSRLATLTGGGEEAFEEWWGNRRWSVRLYESCKLAFLAGRHSLGRDGDE